MKKALSYFSLVLLLSITGCSSKSDDDAMTQRQKINSNVTPRDFLSADTYDKLVVEVNYVQGYEPSDDAITSLTAFLQDRLNKGAGISVVKTQASVPQSITYSVEDAQRIELTNRKQVTSGKTLTAYFFFANGDYSGNSGSSKVLGINYGPSSMIIFEKTIRGISGGLSQPSVASVETIVMEHEFGHVLGLVDNGSPLTSAHLDNAHGKHCSDTNCLMYYNVETSDVIANLFGGTIPSLTAGCLNDLKGNGGK